MHFCKAEIALGGDIRNVADRGYFSPVSWPEIDIIRALHGDEAIVRVEPFVLVEQNPRAERARLAEIYGEGPITQAWGGRNPPAELAAPGIKKLPGNVAWRNPLTGKIEVTDADGNATGEAPPVVLATTTVDKPAELVFGDMTRPAPVPEEPDDAEYYSDEPKARARRR